MAMSAAQRQRMYVLESEAQTKAFFEFTKKRGLGLTGWPMQDKEDFAVISEAIRARFQVDLGL